MKDNRYRILKNKKIMPLVYEMVLEGKTDEISTPGQFINIKVNGFYLRRPISISDWDDNTITVIYKVVGKGTEAMSHMHPGESLMALCPLGNGYNLNIGCDTPLLIGGGLGAAPLYSLAKALKTRGKTPSVIMGVNKQDEIFYTENFRDEGIEVIITCADGSTGIKGFVTAAFDRAEYVFACGPEPMLKAVYDKSADGQFDFGSRMACGFGVCMGCSCETKYGSKRICKDGPVLTRGEIIW